MSTNAEGLEKEIPASSFGVLEEAVPRRYGDYNPRLKTCRMRNLAQLLVNKENHNGMQ